MLATHLVRFSRLGLAIALAALSACGASVDEPDGTSGTGSGTGSGGASAGATNPHPCAAAAPVVVDGIDTGFDLCRDGSYRRREIVNCPLPVTGDPCRGGEGECLSGSDCPGPHASCVALDFGGCVCTGGCISDAECGDGNVCLCGEFAGRCVPAPGCKSDADCEGDLECRTHWRDDPTSGQCGGTFELACQSEADACGGDADCVGTDLCSVDVDGARACRKQGC